jgi:PAS domain S-box-containing protein
LIRADDKPIWVRTVGTVEFRDGRPYRLIGAIQDKTLQVAVRLAIESANQRITLATDNGGIGIWDWDIASNSFICDAWMFRLHGHEPSDETKPLAFWIEHLHPDDRPLVVQALQDAIEHGSPFDTEFRVIWSDGSVHHLKATGQVTRDKAGHPIRMVGTNRDVTEARCLAAELAQQNELLRVTLLSIGDGVVSKDIERKISLMNSAAERMTGWAAAEAVGRPVTEVFHLVHEETRLPADIHVDHNTPSSHRVDITKRILLISRDGTERSIESCATPIYDGRGNLLGSVLVFRDVTEQRRIARETEQITKLQLDLKLKDQFLSHVSHELRSPLTSVYSFTSIIADNLAGETTPQQQEYLQIVLKNVLQLQSMIEDLLTVTQSKEGKLPIDLQDTSAAPAIADAIDNARHAAAAKEIVLAACDASQMPQVCADPVRLRQILIILLDNAIKFTPAGGAISIRTVPQKDMLRFEVEDSGCGIPLEKRARVFEKLYQITGPDYADTSLAGRIGLGLGLHIARDLVRRQGGNIWVAGAPEQGSIFNFTLPLATGSRESAGGAGNPSHHGHSESTERSDLPFSSAA